MAGPPTLRGRGPTGICCEMSAGTLLTICSPLPLVSGVLCVAASGLATGSEPFARASRMTSQHCCSFLFSSRSSAISFSCCAHVSCSRANCCSRFCMQSFARWRRARWAFLSISRLCRRCSSFKLATALGAPDRLLGWLEPEWLAGGEWASMAVLDCTVLLAKTLRLG